MGILQFRNTKGGPEVLGKEIQSFLALDIFVRSDSSQNRDA